MLRWNATANQWEPATLPAGSGGASSASQLLDLRVVKSDPVTLTIGPDCTTTSPCRVRFGSLTYEISAPATVTLSAGSGKAYIYVTRTGELVVGHNLSLSCLNCTAVPNVTAFPPDALPLWTWDAVNGSWVDGGGRDQRAFLSTTVIAPGTGLTSTSSAGQTILSIDTAIVGTRVSVPLASTDPCTPGNWAADTTYYYLCVAPNTWRRAALTSW